MKFKFLTLLLVTASIVLGCGGGGGGGSDGGSNNLTPVDVFSTSVSILSAGNLLSSPKHIAFWGNDLYVANFDGSNIIKITPSGNQSLFASLPSRPLGIVLGAGSQLYVSLFNGTIHSVPSLGVTSNTGLQCNCYGLASDGVRLYWVSGNYVYRDITSSENILLNSSPAGLAFYGSSIYVTRNLATTLAVKKIGINSFQQVPSNVGKLTYAFNGANGIAVDSSGNVYVVNEHVPNVVKISATTGDVTTFLTTAHGLCSPVGLSINSNYLYVSNGCTGQVAGAIPSNDPSILKALIDLTP